VDQRKAGAEANAGRFPRVHPESFVEHPGRVGEGGKRSRQGRYRVAIHDPPKQLQSESLVPDIAYLANYFDLPKAERRYPAVPPDIAVEIRSPDDKLDDVVEKRDFYLWWGVKLVIVVDPEQRTVEAQEADAPIAYLTENDTLTSNAFPTLSIPLRDLFAELDEPD
jgi:Uma2 family endonuclease